MKIELFLQMQHYIKEKPTICLYSEKISENRQMSRTADRQKFCNALNDSQKNGLYKCHIVLLIPAYMISDYSIKIHMIQISLYHIVDFL